MNAALILSEYVLESKNNKQELLLTALDRHVQNAFDVVDVIDHNFLLRKLYLDGIEGDDWLLILDLYSDCSSRVKWAGLMSDYIYKTGCQTRRNIIHLAIQPLQQTITTTLGRPVFGCENWFH